MHTKIVNVVVMYLIGLKYYFVIYGIKKFYLVYVRICIYGFFLFFFFFFFFFFFWFYFLFKKII